MKPWWNGGGRIDALISNAGARTWTTSWPVLPFEDWDPVMAVNLKGAYLCSRAVPARHDATTGWTHPGNLASFSGRVGRHGRPTTRPLFVQAGLVGLTQSLAREVGTFNIPRQRVSPGYLPTALLGGHSGGSGPARRLERPRSDQRNRRSRRFMIFLAGMRNVSGRVFSARQPHRAIRLLSLA